MQQPVISCIFWKMNESLQTVSNDSRNRLKKGIRSILAGTAIFASMAACGEAKQSPYKSNETTKTQRLLKDAVVRTARLLVHEHEYQNPFPAVQAWDSTSPGEVVLSDERPLERYDVTFEAIMPGSIKADDFHPENTRTLHIQSRYYTHGHFVITSINISKRRSEEGKKDKWVATEAKDNSIIPAESNIEQQTIANEANFLRDKMFIKYSSPGKK